jgi:hypothetical protein
LVFLLFILLSACGGTSNLPSKVNGEMMGDKALKKQLLQPVFPASTLSYAGRVKLNSPDMNVSGTVKVHLKNDSVCWIRLSKFGFEVGRFRITPDSIHGINKLQKLFIREDIEATKEILGIHLSFKDIQHLVWGIPMRVSKKDKLRSMDDWVEVESAPDSEIEYAYKIRPPFDMVSATLSTEEYNSPSSQNIKVDQSDFHKITDNRNFSYIRNYSFTSSVDRLAIELNISTVSFDEPQSTDIHIPSGYTPY